MIKNIFQKINFAIKNKLHYFVLQSKKFMKNSNVKDEILLYLEQEERPLAWLSRKTEIPYPTLYSIFIQRIMNLSDKNLATINKVLDTDFIND